MRSLRELEGESRRAGLVLLPIRSFTIQRLAYFLRPGKLFTLQAPPRLLPPLRLVLRRGQLSISMPPKGTKRKASPPASDSEDHSSNEGPSAKKAQPAKKAKAAKGPVTPLDSSLPHNVAFPADLEPFPPKAAGELRLATWNVCGIKACDKKVRLWQKG
jgi:hypothetical protein